MITHISKEILVGFTDVLPNTKSYIEKFGQKQKDGSYKVDLIQKTSTTPVFPEDIYKICLKDNKTWREVYETDPSLWHR